MKLKHALVTMVAAAALATAVPGTALANSGPPAKSGGTTATAAPSSDSVATVSPSGKSTRPSTASPEALNNLPTRVSTKADHCTGFCTSVYNGLSKSVYMKGNGGSGYVRPGKWSDDEIPGLEDVDNFYVPYNCSMFFRGSFYGPGADVRVHGLTPWVWLVGTC